MNGIVMRGVLVGALAGLLFGFDTAVISGVTADLRTVYRLSAAGLGVTVSSALWGTLAGALLAGPPGDRFGARSCLKAIAILYMVSSAGCALAWDWPSLIVFRAMAGLAIGASTVLAPVYVTEIAPPAWRGAMVGLFQFNITLGILVAYPHHRVILHASMIAAGGVPRFLVHGDKGSLVKTGIDQQEAQLLGGMRPGAQGWGVDLDRMQIWNAARECRGMPTPAGDHRRYYTAIRDALRGTASSPVPPIQALAVMAVLEAAILSAEKGTRESVPLTEAERGAFVASRAK